MSTSASLDEYNDSRKNYSEIFIVGVIFLTRTNHINTECNLKFEHSLLSIRVQFDLLIQLICLAPEMGPVNTQMLTELSYHRFQ